jgi:DNA repair protein SbcD/Mre11
MDFTFVHAADLHLDTPFDGVTRVSEAAAARLRDASLEAWDRLVALTLERDAAFLVLAGDIYDGATRGLRAQLRFRDGLERLSRAGAHAFIVHGNHDPLDGWSAIARWPDRVTIFGPDAVASVPVERDGRRIATVHGISYASRDVRDNLALRFRRSDAPGLHVGLLHATVTSAAGAAEHAAYSPCTLADLAAAGMDYWALGHVHQRATLREGAPWVVYPGNLQGRSMKPSERGAKGATVVTVHGGSVTGVEFVACDGVRFAAVDTDIVELEDMGALQDAVLDAVQSAARDAGGRALLCRVRLTGTGGLSGALGEPGTLDELLRAVRDALDAAGNAWCERIENATRPALDFERIRARGDLAAEALARADALRADPAAAAAFIGECAAPITDAGYRAPSDDALRAILDEAAELALGMLEAESDT